MALNSITPKVGELVRASVVAGDREWWYNRRVDENGDPLSEDGYGSVEAGSDLEIVPDPTPDEASTDVALLIGTFRWQTGPDRLLIRRADPSPPDERGFNHWLSGGTVTGDDRVGRDTAVSDLDADTPARTLSLYFWFTDVPSEIEIPLVDNLDADVGTGHHFMNVDIPAAVRSSFDTVDSGESFNVVLALRSALLKPVGGGHLSAGRFAGQAGALVPSDPDIRNDLIRHQTKAEAVWLARATFREPGLSDQVRYWGSRALTLGGIDYRDLFFRRALSGAGGGGGAGLSFGRLHIPRAGGLASVASTSLLLSDLEGESDVGNEYVLFNDEVIFWVVFIDGTERPEDRIEITRGVVHRSRVRDDGTWALTVKDDSRRLLIGFPTFTVDPLTFPRSTAHGRPYPFVFGRMDTSPASGEGRSSYLAPCLVTDSLGGPDVAPALHEVARLGRLWEWNGGGGILAEVLNTSADPETGIITLDGPLRRVTLRGRRARPDLNDLADDWPRVTDNDLASFASLTAGQSVAVYLGGISRLGTMTAIRVAVDCLEGDITVTVRDGDTERATLEGGRGTTTVPLELDDWSSWDLALLNVQVAGRTDADIADIRVEVSFDSFAAADQDPELWAEVQGYVDRVSNYADGNVVVRDGDLLRNPVHQIAAILRDRRLIAAQSQRLVRGWQEAAAARDDWLFDFHLDGQHDADWIDGFLQQAGLAMFPEAGGFSITALDEKKVPTRFFHGDFHMVERELAPASRSHGFQVTPVDPSQIINEIHLRYARHGPTGEYRRTFTLSGHHRLTGLCSVSAAGVLTDAAADFRNVGAGETAYVEGAGDLRVVRVLTATTVEVVNPLGGAVFAVAAGTRYYMGPNLDSILKVSQLSFQTTNALGEQQEGFAEAGGLTSDLIQNPATARRFCEFIRQWFAFPRDRVRFFLPWLGVNLRPGDVCMLEHYRLQAKRRPVMLGDTAQAVAATHPTLTVSVTSVDAVRVDDWLMVQDAAGRPEVWLVTAVDYGGDTITVERAQMDTQPVALATGSPLFRLTVRWLVTDVLPMSPGDGVQEVQAVQMPNVYFPVGRVVSDGYPEFSAATAEQRNTSGWATLFNGRVAELDPDSELSHVGPG